MWTGKIEEHILYEDKEILVCHKPAGVAVQNARIGTMDMESALKNYLAAKQPGQMPYLGIIHRLDQPVEGAVVFAKTKRAAKELSRQMSGGEMGKYYLAVTQGEPPLEKGTLTDYLKKDGRTNTSAVVSPDTPDGKKAVLHYEIMEEIKNKEGKNCYLVRIRLETGRHHQIRVQMAHSGMPLLGDRKYHPEGKTGVSLGLCAETLMLCHPVTGKKMEFRVRPEGNAFENFSIE